MALSSTYSVSVIIFLGNARHVLRGRGNTVKRDTAVFIFQPVRNAPSTMRSVSIQEFRQLPH